MVEQIIQSCTILFLDTMASVFFRYHNDTTNIKAVGLLDKCSLFVFTGFTAYTKFQTFWRLLIKAWHQNDNYFANLGKQYYEDLLDTNLRCSAETIHEWYLFMGEQKQ